jgi:hypothetical protein
MALAFLTIDFPPLFNRVVMRLKRPLARFNAEPLPPIHMRSYVLGLPIQAACFVGMGASVWFTLDAVYPGGVVWTWDTFGYVTAAMALAFVAGFVIIILPSGLGVREYLLIVFLSPRFPGPTTALAVIVVRIVWTISEVIMGGALFLARPRGKSHGLTRAKHG